MSCFNKYCPGCYIDLRPPCYNFRPPCHEIPPCLPFHPSFPPPCGGFGHNSPQEFLFFLIIGNLSRRYWQRQAFIL